MDYRPKDYTGLIGMKGFSQGLLENHFTLYQGYVANTNKLLASLAAMLKDGKTSTPEYAEMKRRLGFEFDGMRLHEYYFGNLGGEDPLQKTSMLSRRIAEEFGSYDAWEKDFRATAAIRGIGWCILYQDNLTGNLINMWVNEHEIGHPAGCDPILVLDVFEHAFMIDYGLKRAEYVEAFFKNVKWAAAESRLR